MDEEPPISRKRILAVYAFLAGLILVVVAVIYASYDDNDRREYAHCKTLVEPYTREMVDCIRDTRAARQIQR